MQICADFYFWHLFKFGNQFNEFDRWQRSEQRPQYANKRLGVTGEQTRQPNKAIAIARFFTSKFPLAGLCHVA